jgi:hypothetical protein
MGTEVLEGLSMTERKRFCPAPAVREVHEQINNSEWVLKAEDHCYNELPCRKHNVITPAQGHALYGKIILELLPGEDGYDEST